ncbi:MAG: hypothetical protein HOB81_02755 [Flavobacteriaceae bacterium]|nr:hypothetical protein [Flavobacteriaceae bacterium]|tara:strand:- start:254 stop:439 length:186 start_codon:yes stop_codon:yes gene_type:complete
MSLKSWKDKRIGAMNRQIKRKGLHYHEKHFDEYDFISNRTKANNKKEYKKERLTTLQGNID